MRFLTIILFIFCSLLTSVNIKSQDNRPKVALVLSGGGAKGLAHIGVLKVLEEAGIRPDIITGTSMGSIVGGLYALGYSAEWLENLVITANWDELLSNDISLKNIVMEEKADYDKYLLEFPVKNNKVLLPSGLIEGQKLSQAFSEFCWRAIGIENFDQYPIQFRCVASDIISGEVIEFSKGDLAKAMRASMAIPTVFTPVLSDSDRLLVDGGVMRNFPVEEAIDLGADIIIGVYVGFKDKVSPDDLYSFTDVLTRTSVFYGIADYNEQVKKVDIYIEPDLSGFNAANFKSAQKIVQRGEVAAREKMDEFNKLAKLLDSFPTPPVKILPDPDLVFIKEIEVKNNVNLTKDFIIAKSGLKENNWISKRELEQALDNVYGTRFVDKISYEFRYDKDGYILIFDVDESVNTTIKTAVHFDNDFGAGVNVNITTRNFLLPNTKLSATGYISRVPRLNIYYNKYIGQNQNFMFTLGNLYENNQVPTYSRGKEIGKFRHLYNEIYTSTCLFISRNNEIEIKGAYEYTEIKPSESVKLVNQEMNFNLYKYGNYSLTFNFDVNYRNNRYFPTWGNQLNIMYKKSFNPEIDLETEDVVLVDTGFFRTNLESYYIFQTRFNNIKSFTDRFIVEDEIALGLTSSNTVVSELFFTGGINEFFRHNCISMAGFSIMEKTFRKFIKIKLGFNYKITDKIYFTTITNVLKHEYHTESLFMEITKYEPNDTYFGYAAGFKYDSFIGPVVFMIGENNRDSNVRLYFSVGHDF